MNKAARDLLQGIQKIDGDNYVEFDRKNRDMIRLVCGSKRDKSKREGEILEAFQLDIEVLEVSLKRNA
ncbi:hypothetical protein RYX36_030821 [Vicia faba]